MFEETPQNAEQRTSKMKKMWISQKDARQYAIGIPGEISMRKKWYVEVMAEILPVTSINNLQSGKAH